jgi:hypothetical protein
MGQMAVSNGTVTISQFTLATFSNAVGRSLGTLTMAGGSLKSLSSFTAGSDPGTTGIVWVTGGQIGVSTSMILGYLPSKSFGGMTISNGAVTTTLANIGNSRGLSGSLALYNGGVMTVYSNMLVGYCPQAATGSVLIAGGSLYVSNDTSTAVLDLSGGTLTLSSGLLYVDKFVITNTCARFVFTGGTLLYSQSLLSSNLDADGDGLPNYWEDQYGLGPLNPFGDDGGDGDPDGDGFTNLQEFQLGTNPKDPNSPPPFRVTSISPEGNNLRIRWTTFGGITNFVQAASSPKGPYVDISPAFVIPGVTMSASATNYLDIGEATGAARFYRIRLGTRGTVPVLSAVTPNSGLDTATGLTLLLAGNNFLSGATVMLRKTGQPDVVGGGVTLSGSTNLTAAFNLSNVATGLWNVVVANPNSQPATLNNGFTVILDPAGDRDNDGLPNGWESQYGLDPFSATGNDGASGDPDGDGMTNLQEYLAGTDPTNSASAFHIASITQESNNIRVAWMMGPGKTNALERTAGAGGSFSNNFVAIFTVTNTVGTTTNYLDLGAATNNPARWYRVRLIP